MFGFNASMKVYSVQNFNLYNNRTKSQNCEQSQARLNMNTSGSVAFSGTLHESYKKDGYRFNPQRKMMSHETTFFHGLETLKGVKDFINTNLSRKDSIRIFNAGCSSGQESWTLAMLVNDIGKKPEITAFDVSQEMIDYAQKGVYNIDRPYGDNASKATYFFSFSD